MNLLSRISAALGVVIVGTYLAHRYLLNDEQRAEVAAVREEMRASVEEVADAVSPITSKGGPTRSEERAAAEANRARTKAQWAAIGY